ncbi:MAG: replicative DNA helicase [Candidatus Zixiibacteriota bacterium]|nr:MAG: replicative DNA helicase [candidate division Zixibacteria bacterium]
MAYRTQTNKQVDQLQPPQSLEVEQSILGAILKDPEAINRVVDIIQDSRDFYAPKHQLIFQAAVDLYEQSEPIDITTVASRLQDRNHLEKIGGRVYLVELAEQVASTGNVASYANIVLEKSVLRRLISTSNEILRSCYALEMPAEELLDQAEANIFSISESRLRQGFAPMKSLVTDSLEQIDAMQLSEGGLAGLKTGFHDLDTMTLGLQKSELIIVAGRPSMGKTSLAMNIAEHIATVPEKKKTVGIFSIEMSKDALVFRMLCGRARLDQHKLRSGKLKDSEWPRLSTAGNLLSQASIFVDDSPSLSPLEVRAKARRLMAQHGLDLIIVDYIQLMHGNARVENRQQEIAIISRNLKALAKELDIPVIAISQLSRAVEQRGGDKRPQLADLRESGAIEQDADVVLLVYRPEMYMSHLDRNDPKYLEVEGRAEIIVAKQRNGPTGTVRLGFIKNLARFENLETRRPDLPEGVNPVGDGNVPF